MEILAMKTTLSLLALGAALTASAAAAQDTLTISVYSFAQDAYKEALYDPFEEICGCDLVIETGNSVERMAKIEANADDPVIDMAVISSHDALSLANKGLLQPLDTSQIASFDRLYPAAQDPLGGNMAVGYTFYASSIVYREDLVSISSWSDLLGDELAGNVSLPNITGTQGPLTLMMLDKAAGGDASDFSGTISAIGAHADEIVTFYSRSSELAQLMNQEEVIAAPVGRFAWSRFKSSPLPFAWAEPAEGQAGGMNVMIMTKDNGNEELVYMLMDYWLSTEVQTRIAEALIDSPANMDVEVSAEVAENLTYGADLINALNIIDPAAIIDNRDAWVEQWNTEVLQ
ncbi:MAG: extracellular solute-binding protein [Pseudomonadota bacterium]